MNRLLVLGTADWNQAIATNQHTMVRELAREFPLIYTESMGLRQPELKMRDVKRMARRLKPTRATSEDSQRPIPGGVEVRSPKVLPRHVGLAYRVNQPRVQRLVGDWVAQPGPRVLWTYTPVTYGLEQIADSVIYHCVDLLGAVEGIDSDVIDAWERRLAEAGGQAIGSSEVVVRHLNEIGFREVLHWPNVADTEVIESARPQTISRVAGRAVFAGNLSTSKVDFPLLAQLVDAGVDLHLAGPISEGGGSAAAQVRELAMRGATYHGLLNLYELAELYWTAEVGLIPYVLNDYTQGVNPLKTYEYLAAGLEVVATKVPAVVDRPGHVLVADNAAEFVEAVFGASQSNGPSLHLRQRAAIASRNSWQTRGGHARDLARQILRPVS